MNEKLIKALFEGVVTIVFEKIDTKEIRTMPCTLNKDLHKQTISIKSLSAMDTIVCYALVRCRTLNPSQRPGPHAVWCGAA